MADGEEAVHFHKYAAPESGWARAFTWKSTSSCETAWTWWVTDQCNVCVCTCTVTTPVSAFSSTGICIKVFLAFSVYTNGSKLLCTTQPSSSLTCVHGIRFLSMTWVVLGHSYIFPISVAGKVTLKSKRIGFGWERERENSNSKTLFYKDCSLGSVKNLSNS